MKIDLENKQTNFGIKRNSKYDVPLSSRLELSKDKKKKWRMLAVKKVKRAEKSSCPTQILTPGGADRRRANRIES